MRRYLAQRILLTIPLLLTISVLSFALMRAAPGDALTAYASNPSISREDIERIRENLGLDRPWPVQYLSWLSGVLRGDLGRSMMDGRSVAEKIGERVPNTLLLTGLALLLQYAIAVPLGVYAALNHRRAVDQAINVYAAFVAAVPGFWLAILLIFMFSVQFQSWGLPWLPSGGMKTVVGGGDAADVARHLILPVLALALPNTASITRFTRTAMLEQLGQDYVRTARAKGLARLRASYHAFRNSLIPLVTLLGLNLPFLFGGALIVEYIFSWPGMGQLAYTAATQRDYSLLMALVVVSSTLVILGNLMADVLYGVVDPRVRY